MITLSSDFGSPYPAAMKGVLLARCDARLVDVAHDFPRQSVPIAAFWLREILPHFPPAVHLVVVDPGVGTDRAAIVVRAGDHALVGPDNGVLVPVARALAADFDVFEIGVDDPASTTFHGRDVFAPAAASVHEAGIDRFHESGPFTEIETWEELNFPTPTLGETGASGEVLAVDSFGNAITNLPGVSIAGTFGSQVRVNGVLTPVRHTYAAVDVGTALLTVGSHGNVELAVNRGRGDDAFGVESGSHVEMEF